jgi:serine phosphatase RsbU (regulator of sigma subunit)/anti-sigma regulatory factor (Ser/Thr protein kinase)/CHASE1-domain containing sensor protein
MPPTSSPDKLSPRSPWLRSLVPLVIVVALAGATGLAALVVHLSEERAASDERRSRILQAEATMRSVIGEPVAAFSGLAGLLDENGEIRDEAFQRWGAGALDDSVVLAAAYVPFISADERPDFEARIGGPVIDLEQPGEFVTAPERDQYWPVAMVTPDAGPFRGVLGFDLRPQPIRGDAIRQAIADRESRISSPFAGATQGATGLGLYHPLVEDDGNVVGVVAGTLSAASLLERVEGQLPAGTGVRVVDDATVLFESGMDGEDGERSEILVQGRQWQLDVAISDDEPSRVPFVLLGGIGLVVLTAGFSAYALRQDRHNTERLEALTDFTSSIATVDSTTEVVDAAVAPLRASFGADVVWISIRNDDDLIENLAASGTRSSLAREYRYVAPDDDSPISVAITTGKRVWLRSLDQWRRSFPVFVPVVEGEGVVATVVQPFASSKAVGAIALSFRRSPKLTEDDLALLENMAGVLAEAIARARASDFEREAVSTLQHALLPIEVLPDASLDIAVRYEPALEGIDLGGDWYDLFELPGGRIGIAAGDVVGRGVGAAAVMGQLRAALRAIAANVEPPAEVLARLDEFATSTDGAFCTTVVYAVLDLESGTLRYSSAGHVPPLVLDPAAGPTYLERGRGLPLGVVAEGAERTEEAVVLVPDTLLVVYTDGLVEGRTRALQEGLDLLAVTLERHRHLPIEDLADTLLAGLAQPDSEDDTALVCVRLPLDRAPTITLRFGSDPEHLAPLRHRLSAWLSTVGVPPEHHHDIVLCVAEAASNAIEHGARGPESQVVVEAAVLDHRVAVTVRDRGRWRGRVPAPERGRGLLIVDALMDEVSVESGRQGTVVRMAHDLAGDR